MTNDKLQLISAIVTELSNDSELRSIVLRTLLMNDTINIADLVKYKEDAMKEILSKNKEDLSNASALLIRHIDKINTKSLKEDSEKFIKDQGFFNVK